MKNLKIFIGLLVLLSLGAVAVMVLWTMGPSREKEMALKKPTDSADLKFGQVHYTETRGGEKEWELEAASAVYFKEENTVIFQKVKATFFGKNGETYVLLGERAKFNTQTKTVEVFEGVKLDSSDGYHLRTQTLKYLAEKRELSTPDPVEMNGPQMRIEGVGLVVELENQRVKVLRQVTTTLSHLAMKDYFRPAM